MAPHPARGRARAWYAAVPLMTLALAGCGLLPASSAGHGRAPGAASVRAARAATPSPGHPPRPACPRRPRGFSCVMRARIAAAERYLRNRPGITGVVLRDRVTGAVWRSRHAGTQVYMASTSKLAMAVTLLRQNQAGVIHLASDDWATLHQMLHVSSDRAADDLWFKFGAPLYTGYFPRIGLATAHYLPQAGVRGAYWGEMTCPATAAQMFSVAAR